MRQHASMTMTTAARRGLNGLDTRQLLTFKYKSSRRNKPTYYSLWPLRRFIISFIYIFFSSRYCW